MPIRQLFVFVVVAAHVLVATTTDTAAATAALGSEPESDETAAAADWLWQAQDGSCLPLPPRCFGRSCELISVLIGKNGEPWLASASDDDWAWLEIAALEKAYKRRDKATHEAMGWHLAYSNASSSN